MFLEAQGLAHGLISPVNILLSKTGMVKIGELVHQLPTVDRLFLILQCSSGGGL
jgi:hypothetical protein